VRFEFYFGVTPSAGGDLAGTSTNLTAGVDMLPNNQTGRWLWQLGSRYAVRQPVDLDRATTRTLSFAGWIERFLADRVSFRLWARSVDQTSAENISALTGAYTTAGLSMVWYPLGRGTPLEF